MDWNWPEWITQNGVIEFSATLPPISTGLSTGLEWDSSSCRVEWVSYLPDGES